MKRIWLGLLSLGIMMGIQCRTMPDEKPDLGRLIPEEKPDPAELIRQLGADEWPTREKAQDELTKLGKGLIEAYRRLKLEVGSLKLEV